MLMLFDRDESFIASLKYKNIARKREINGLNTLEFETNKEVEFGQRLLFKDREGLWHEYIIIDYFKTHDQDGLTYEVYCEDNTSELYGHYIDDLKPRNELAATLLKRVLEGTRFEVGVVEDFGKRSFNLYRTNVKAALWKTLEEYGAEIQVRLDVDKDGIKHRYIDLKKSIGRDAGKRFTYKKDMGSIKKTTSIKDLVTALYGYGKGEEIVGEDGQPSGGYGRKIDFAELNNGKKYVEDEEARKKYGTGPERKHIFGIADFDDCEDRAELLELTKAKLKELSKPKISYELSVEDISRYEGFEGEAVGLGDTVTVIDEEINTRVQTRIIAIKDNPLEEIEDSEITLGNFIKDLSSSMVEYDQLKSSFENNRNKFNDELKKLAEGVKTSYMQKVLEKFNQELNETGGWVYAEEGEGLLILNAPKDGNPTQAINLKGGKIAIANHKNPDGSFAYETFGDGDGFTANLIRTGILRGDKVRFDLNNGTFLIGDSSTDYTMYWDGKVLHLRNVDIDLSNNYQIAEINEKIEENTNNFNKSIVNLDDKFNSSISGLDDKFNTSIKGLDGRLTGLSSSVDSRFTEAAEDVDARFIESDKNTDKKLADFGGDFDTKISNIKGQIDSVQQDFKVGQGNFESSINTRIKDLTADIEVDLKDINKKISGNVTGIANLDSKIKQTESSITQSVSNQIAAVNKKIDDEATGVKTYVQDNYSTKTQTANLISDEIGSVKEIITSTDGATRKYIKENYSTTVQTNEKIASEIKSVNTKITNNDDKIRKYISENYSTKLQTNEKIVNEVKSAKSYTDDKYKVTKDYITRNYSTTTQTDRMIEKKVSSYDTRLGNAESKITQTANSLSSKISSGDARSIFKQEAKKFTFDAEQIDFNSLITLRGRFETVSTPETQIGRNQFKTTINEYGMKMEEEGTKNHGLLSIAAGFNVLSNRLRLHATGKKAGELSRDSKTSTLEMNEIYSSIRTDGFMWFTAKEEIKIVSDTGVSIDSNYINLKNTKIKNKLNIGGLTIWADDDTIWFKDTNNNAYYISLRKKTSKFGVMLGDTFY